MKPRVFSGIQPTGVLHIGNYLGAITSWVDLQDDYDCVFSIVDLHAVTVPYEPKELAESTLRTANIYLAAGIDPARSNIFVQSCRPEHTELTWLLNCVANVGELNRMTQFKDKSPAAKGAAGVGLFDYPVLMAADILLYRTDLVPVGADQKQHVELSRDLAIRFNNRFGETFRVPEIQIREIGARIMGLDDPAKKMSKTAPSPNSYIALTDPDEVIRKKIARAVTDSGTDIRSGPDKPALTNLLTIYGLFAEQPIAEIERNYSGRGYADFKRGLAELVVDKLRPFKERFEKLEAEPEKTREILAQGAEAAAPIARQTLAEVKKKMGFFACG
jgi:tryptophanyl-tRNA synthetase